jgi:hypothetical protein
MSGIVLSLVTADGCSACGVAAAAVAELEMPNVRLETRDVTLEEAAGFSLFGSPVRYFPTIILSIDGEILGRIQGSRDKTGSLSGASLRAWIERRLSCSAKRMGGSPLP